MAAFTLFFSMNLVALVWGQTYDFCPTACSDEDDCPDGVCDDGEWGADGYECATCDGMNCDASCQSWKGCGDSESEAECNDGYVFQETSISCDDSLWIKVCVEETTSDDTDSDTDTQDSTDTDETDDTDDTDDTDNTDSDTTDSDDVIDTEYAIAKLDASGLLGSVVVSNGHVMVYLDLSEFLFDSLETQGGESCVEDGLYYGVYETWAHDSYSTEFGASCGSDSTGHRFDPWRACSDLSNNEYCYTSPYAASTSHEGCVPPQMHMEFTDTYDSEYTCSSSTFASSPFACEVGDWSGKYGKLEASEWTDTSKIMVDIGSSAFEMDSYDLTGRSVVFRCGHDLSRAICAGFETFDPEENDLDETMYDSSFRTGGDGESDEWESLTRPVQTDSNSKIANFSSKSWIKLGYDGTYQIEIDLRSDEAIVIGGSCEDLIYRIFDDEECEGAFWDPTVTCNEDSAWEDSYCFDTLLCDDEDYSYTCESDGYYLNVDRFLCGPGDLYNKYGHIERDSSTFIVRLNGTDSLLPPLSQLSGKSISLQCSNDFSLAACATFYDVGDNPDVSDFDSSNSNGSSSDDSNNFMGVSDEVLIVLAVLLACLLVPCLRFLFKKYKTSNESDSDPYDSKNRTASGPSRRAGAAAATTGRKDANRNRNRNRSGNANTKNEHSKQQRTERNAGESQSQSYTNRSFGVVVTDAYGVSGPAAGVAGSRGTGMRPSRPTSARSAGSARSMHSAQASHASYASHSAQYSQSERSIRSMRSARSGREQSISRSQSQTPRPVGSHRSRMERNSGYASSREPSVSASLSGSRSHRQRPQTPQSREYSRSASAPGGGSSGNIAARTGHERVGTDSLSQRAAQATGSTPLRLAVINSGHSTGAHGQSSDRRSRSVGGRGGRSARDAGGSRRGIHESGASATGAAEMNLASIAGSRGNSPSVSGSLRL